MADRRGELLSFLAERSVQTGDFVLSSGKRSNVYVDVRLSATSARGMTLLGPALIELMKAEGWWKPDAVAGPTLGADPLLGAISYASALLDDPVDHLIVRKEAKGHGGKKWIEGTLEGVHRVVVVEDVWSTGGSAERAIEAVRASGLEVVAIVAVIDRELGARERLAPLPAAALFQLSEVLAAKGVTPE